MPLSPHKGRSKTLLRLVAVAALVLVSNWVVEPEFQAPTADDLTRAEHAAHMANFNWSALIGASHVR
jgi:hypothetical protein